MLVREIIDDGKREWKDNMIWILFSEEATTEILKLALVSQFIVDTLMCWPNKRGVFTIKSAYWLGMLGLLIIEG